MIRIVAVPLLIFATAASAQECVYKAVMTDAELAACRNPTPQPKPHVPTAAEKSAAEERKARSDAYWDKLKWEQAARDTELAKLPSAPEIGMTEAQVLALLAANEERVKRHPNARDWDRNWTKWDYCPDKNRTTNSRGVSEQWVCSVGLGSRRYLYFNNGVLTSIQD